MRTFSGRCQTIVSVAALFACVAGANAQEVKDINVALIIPQSGPVMVNVDPAVKSYRMAIEEVREGHYDWWSETPVQGVLVRRGMQTVGCH